VLLKLTEELEWKICERREDPRIRLVKRDSVEDCSCSREEDQWIDLERHFEEVEPNQEDI
jgi:hypothetical protein